MPAPVAPSSCYSVAQIFPLANYSLNLASTCNLQLLPLASASAGLATAASSSCNVGGPTRHLDDPWMMMVDGASVGGGGGAGAVGGGGL